MSLINVYADRADEYAGNVAFLYELLAEREAHESISHKVMPTLGEHRAFVESLPYEYWYIVCERGQRVGAVYLTRKGEVGVSILRDHRRSGYASKALRLLMAMHPGRMLANLNPANEASIALFRKLGFTGPIQITMERP